MRNEAEDMPTKEMKMVSFTLDQESKKQLESLAKSKGLTVSDVIRLAIDNLGLILSPRLSQQILLMISFTQLQCTISNSLMLSMTLQNQTKEMMEKAKDRKDPEAVAELQSWIEVYEKQTRTDLQAGESIKAALDLMYSQKWSELKDLLEAQMEYNLPTVADLVGEEEK